MQKHLVIIRSSLYFVPASLMTVNTSCWID